MVYDTFTPAFVTYSKYLFFLSHSCAVLIQKSVIKMSAIRLMQVKTKIEKIKITNKLFLATDFFFYFYFLWIMNWNQWHFFPQIPTNPWISSFYFRFIYVQLLLFMHLLFTFLFLVLFCFLFRASCDFFFSFRVYRFLLLAIKLWNCIENIS